MNKFITTAFALVTTVAIGQAAVAPEAADLLEKAKTAHGGAAWDSLKTYEETGDATYFDEKGNPQITLRLVQRIDFANERLRVEAYQATNLVLVQQYDPKGSSAWNLQSGTIKLPKAEAESLRESFFTGVPNLRFGKNRDAATVAKSQTWLNLSGNAVNVTTKGVKAEYLLSADGVVLAERSSIAQVGSVIYAYSDIRDVNGLKLPFETKAYAEEAKNLLFFQVKTSEIKINRAFTDKDFEMPK
jgi:hypothetical protein